MITTCWIGDVASGSSTARRTAPRNPAADDPPAGPTGMTAKTPAVARTATSRRANPRRRMSGGAIVLDERAGGRVGTIVSNRPRLAGGERRRRLEVVVLRRRPPVPDGGPHRAIPMRDGRQAPTQVGPPVGVPDRPDVGR